MDNPRLVQLTQGLGQARDIEGVGWWDTPGRLWGLPWGLFWVTRTRNGEKPALNELDNSRRGA